MFPGEPRFIAHTRRKRRQYSALIEWKSGVVRPLVWLFQKLSKSFRNTNEGTEAKIFEKQISTQNSSQDTEPMFTQHPYLVNTFVDGRCTSMPIHRLRTSLFLTSSNRACAEKPGPSGTLISIFLTDAARICNFYGNWRLPCLRKPYTPPVWRLKYYYVLQGLATFRISPEKKITPFK